ncbi:MAG: hypothetical protein IT335_01175 [Thermomicrobiales bacterium]|nr:hypothetical protein [Thermomicrobiales bacterium]
MAEIAGIGADEIATAMLIEIAITLALVEADAERRPADTRAAVVIVTTSPAIQRQAILAPSTNAEVAFTAPGTRCAVAGTT